MSGIVAILPAFNEEVSIGSVVLLARQHADRVILIDCGSHPSGNARRHPRRWVRISPSSDASGVYVRLNNGRD